MGLEKIKIIDLEKIVHLFNYPQEDVQAKVLLNILNENWRKIAGELYENHAEPVKVMGSTIFINVSHPAYKMEISFIKDRLISEANKAIGRPLFNQIAVNIGKVRHQKVQKKDKTGNLHGKDELVELIQKEEDEETRRKLLKLIEKF